MLREEKRLYDMEYRRKNRVRLKKKKAVYHLRTYDPIKEAKRRKERMPYHIAYCQKPAYRAWKHEYDSTYRYKYDYGIFWEVMRLVTKIQKKVRELIPDKYERLKMRGHILRNMRNMAIRKGWFNRACIWQTEMAK